ncbi:hypothetical protein HNV08_03315 [Winogradskyella eckloniae]|uniref:hypothetical protein n=1 Tax=Winogradskyella eckloniae TaxID=1089306 RepID=UPI0015670064|nr:hypothetical protein [Winogradskyella eckloniae]NRD19064.1 hypothetical protein [Winogradskyella eckloniae]
MKRLVLICILMCFFSCNEKEEQLEKELHKLTIQNHSLQSKVDSLENIPAIKFESLLQKDVLADSLRKSHINDFIPNYRLNKIRTQDSVLIEKYIEFAKNNKQSYLSTYALDRVQDIKIKRKQIKINDIVGSWQWEGVTNLMNPLKGTKNEHIVFNTNQTVTFYRNNKRVSEETFEIEYPTRFPTRNYIRFSKRGIYAIALKKNGILTLTKGVGICMDCGTHIYRKQ